MTDQLAALYFGRDDAETDITEGGLLRAGFLRTSVYEAVRGARKHLIIGRKGSGKSAICRTLATEPDPSRVTILVTPDELSADEIRRFELQGISPEKAKSLVWRYELSTQVARHLVTHAKAAHGKNRPASVESLRRFLVANGELDEERPKFWQIIQKLKGSVSLEAFGVKGTVELGGPSEGIRTANQLDVIERNVIKAIRDLACPDDHPHLLILVDQLEDVWSNDSDSDKLVIGLLHAMRDVSARFPRVSCVTFLRSDIYNVLQFTEKDKLRSAEKHVDWNDRQLLDRILSRARASLGEPITEDWLWRHIFPAAIQGMPSSDFVLSHTLMRPRDVIQLCNRCRDIAEQNGHETITESDVMEAIAQYSNWKLQDLANEYQVNYPFLGGLLGMFRNAGYLFGRGVFEKRLAAALDVLRDRYRDKAHMLIPDVVLGVLFDVGFLGVHRNGKVLYRHRNEDRVESDDEVFFIHPGFRYALHSEQSTTTAAFEPGRLQFDVTVGVRGQYESGFLMPDVGRGSTESRLLNATRSQATRLIGHLHEAGLPVDMRKDISANLERIIRSTDDLGESHLGSALAVTVGHVVEVANFLRQLGENLEHNGFGTSGEALTFIRRAGEAGSRLRRQAEGIDFI
jgi:hypothetical protein